MTSYVRTRTYMRPLSDSQRFKIWTFPFFFSYARVLLQPQHGLRTYAELKKSLIETHNLHLNFGTRRGIKTWKNVIFTHFLMVGHEEGKVIPSSCRAARMVRKKENYFDILYITMMIMYSSCQIWNSVTFLTALCFSHGHHQLRKHF